ncbi:MAG: hypothetical protein CMM94_01330 [Rickettsiales bacterium]|nr:hypothetical protein [Rickettsiales bacterium]
MLALLGFAVMPAMAASQMDCCSTNGMQDANAQTALEVDMAVEMVADMTKGLPCHEAANAKQGAQNTNDSPCDNCQCEKLSQSKTVLPNAMPTRGKRMKEAAHPIPLIFHFDRTPRTLKRPPRIEA